MSKVVEWTWAISGLIDGERRLFDRISPKRCGDFRGWEEELFFRSFERVENGEFFSLKLINLHKSARTRHFIGMSDVTDDGVKISTRSRSPAFCGFRNWG